MIRIAHFSDLHYGVKTMEEADRCFAAAIDQAMAKGAQVAVISGDATDHALDLHAPAAERLMSQVRRLADHCPVLMLQGTFSHEPPGTLAPFRLLGGRHPVFVADRICQIGLDEQGQWNASAGWRFKALPSDLVALFSCVPTVNKAVVAATVGCTQAAQAVGQHLERLLLGFADVHCEARRLCLPTIAVSHGTVYGCISEHGVPMAGFDHEFTTGALFAARVQAFMLGHIHRHQSWKQSGVDGEQCIAYPGSIGRFHHGEAGDKGFLLWDVGADDVAMTFVPTPARRTIDLVFEGRPDLEALREAIAQQDVQGAHVRVRWTVAVEDRHEVDRKAMEKMLAAAQSVQMEGRVVQLMRSRSEGIAQLATLEQKVRAWATASEVSCDGLLECLEALREAEPDVIAQRILAARPEDGGQADESDASVLCAQS
ncbi:metallophosphoesterase family protein [Aquabacterium sp.]|uniref:metallophosphoesterase family protein n=1 Tax=Aquabacterium sp. TaxID=1872578 RepID=UPI0040377E74